MPITPGSRIENYDVLASLGGGGMGEIWLARDVSLDRMIALKVLRTDVTQDKTRVTRFRQEARTASALNHPNVCTIHALGETADGQQFIAMEHIVGETLRGRLNRARPSPEDLLGIIVQVAAALTAAHTAGIVHRDLKPENVMLRPDGLVKVVDFGLAKLSPASVAAADATRSVAHTDAGLVVGTIAYMSPEQARGEEVDARTDIWSLGVMLYEMIAGRNPFAATSTSEVLAAILDRVPVPLARFEPDAPAELQRIVTKTLRKDREQRYQSMKELLLDLEALRREWATQLSQIDPVEAAASSGIADPTGAAPRHGSGGGQALAPFTRRQLVAVLVACAVVVIAGSAWWMLFRRPSAANEVPSVAVLPFTTIGAGDTYFADGITEAVTTELGRVTGLRVIASNTAFGYRDKTIRDIARDLAVAHVVTGSVQRANDNVRIDVSLVNARDEVASWTEHYNRPLIDTLSVQDEISGRIAGTISTRFAASAAKPSLATSNSQAYDAYLRGLWHLRGRSVPAGEIAPGSVRRLRAIEELERAVGHDPNFALAHAALASAYTQRLFYDVPDPVLEEKGFLHIKRALAINPDVAEAYLARAQLRWNLRHGFPHAEAIKDLRHALTINPNLVEAYVELGKVYYHIGLTGKAVEANERAQWLDPADRASVMRRLLALVDGGQVDAVRTEVDHNRPRLGVYPLCEALLALGRTEEAATVLLRATAEQSDIAGFDRGPQFEAHRAVLFALLGRGEEARRMLADAMPRAENPAGLSHVHHAQFHIGAALGLLGRKDDAVRWLTKAVNEGYPSYPRFSRDRTLEPLKGHPGFEALLASLRQRHEQWLKSL